MDEVAEQFMDYWAHENNKLQKENERLKALLALAGSPLEVLMSEERSDEC